MSLQPAMSPAAAATRIARITGGHTHGAMSRLFSPGDLGQTLKPFVFLDYFDEARAPLPAFGYHPHSGIATLTYLLEGRFAYEDSAGMAGILEPGGVEWIFSGAGVWHRAEAIGPSGLRGFQLWIALPAHLELDAAHSRYQSAMEIPASGPARILLGAYAGLTSPLGSPADITYLAVSLRAGKRWAYAPPAGHRVVWAAAGAGCFHAPERVAQGELAVFESWGGEIEFLAETDVTFVLGSAAPHPHALALGYHSVHTSPEALAQGERRISEIGQQLRAAAERRRPTGPETHRT